MKNVKKIAAVLVIMFATFVATIAGEAYLLVRDIQKANQAPLHHQEMVRQWKA